LELNRGLQLLVSFDIFLFIFNHFKGSVVAIEELYSKLFVSFFKFLFKKYFSMDIQVGEAFGPNIKSLDIRDLNNLKAKNCF